MLNDFLQIIKAESAPMEGPDIKMMVGWCKSLKLKHDKIERIEGGFKKSVKRY
jgi:hypothetical protein